MVEATETELCQQKGFTTRNMVKKKIRFWAHIYTIAAQNHPGVNEVVFAVMYYFADLICDVIDRNVEKKCKQSNIFDPVDQIGVKFT